MTIRDLDLNKYRLSQTFNSEVGVKQKITVVPVKKPNPSMFIRVMEVDDNNNYECHVLENKELDETFLVDPGIANSILHELTAKRLYLAIDKQNNIFIWAIKLPDEFGKLDSWNTSAHSGARAAFHDWVRIKSNRSLGAYDTFVASGNLKEPEWPDLTFEEILNIAFHGKIIDSNDHPILKKLRGEIL